MRSNISRPTTLPSPKDSETILPDYERTDIGVIPRDWTARSLRSLLRSAPSYGINAAAVPFDESLPTYLRITDISEDNKFRPSPRVSVRHPHVEAFFLSKGDLVFARTGASVGKSYLYTPDDGPLVFAGFLVRVNPDPLQIHPAFLSYCVQSNRYWDWVATMSIRSGQPGINGQEYGTFLLPLPPPSEQHAIAEALSDVDRLLEALDTLISKKKAIKQATMQKLLAGKTRLPGFSGNWKKKRLGQCVTFLRTGAYARAKLTGEGSLKYLHYGDIHTTTRVRLDPRTDSMPSLPYECARTLDRLRDGDLVFVDASEDLDGVGKSVEITGTSDIEVVSGLHTIAARFEKSFLAHGFKAYLQFYPAFRNHLRRLAAGTKVYATNRTHISSAEIRLPGNREQTAIATVLSDLDAEISALERRHDKIRSVKLGMMQQLLTGRMRLVKPESLQNNEETA